MIDGSEEGEDEYGDLEDDELLLAATQIEGNSDRVQEMYARRNEQRPGNENNISNDIEKRGKAGVIRPLSHNRQRHRQGQDVCKASKSFGEAQSGILGQRQLNEGGVLAQKADGDRYTLKTDVKYLGAQVNERSNKAPVRPQPQNESGLENVPLDAFDSSPVREIRMVGLPQNGRPRSAQNFRPQQVGHRQMTLFGGIATHEQDSTSEPKRAWPMANREEAQTHHALNTEALKTWVYPKNLGVKRDYQFNIVQRGLFHNLLVALPTGLGKTFIAATIMLNWFRWTESAQIVFVAPTKPLVAQQIQACFNIVGIPRSQTTMMTGNVAPGLRTQEWESRRVFFMTPQTFINDLKTGICDPKRIVLVVVDEAHRATGGYAYVEVVKFIRRFNPSFRILALTATPGASVEQVQEVIDGLDISRVEIRTEHDLDIRKFVHQRNIDTEVFEPTEEMNEMKGLFSRALQPLLDKLVQQNATWTKDPMALSPYMLTTARATWSKSDAGRKASMPLKSMMNSIFTVLASLAHAITLLNFHGLGPFYHNLLSFRDEIEAHGEKGSKYRKQVNDSEPFNRLMTTARSWMHNPEYLGHPKLEYLQRVVLNHFIDAEEQAKNRAPAQTRIMVFVHYRDSAEEVARVLKRHQPTIRPHIFVGQAASKGSEGMDQKKQLAVIEDFQSGVYNTLVATSIGEEGLDIGEVDLIICYDASASPIRMLQRMGRTGRKRAGNIVLLLMRGKEEDSFTKAKDSYEKMQVMIADGKRFNFHEDLSPRILPRTAQPELDERMIEIPIENTQAALPEPKRKGRIPKRPPKKFHMPDGVSTGFVKASRFGNAGGHIEDEDHDSPLVSQTAPEDQVRIPALKEVLLSESEDKQLERLYQNVGGSESQVVPELKMDAYPDWQRTLGHTDTIPHGHYTRRVVKMFKAIHDTDIAKVADLEACLETDDLESLPRNETEEDESRFSPKPFIANASKVRSRTAPKLIPRISNVQLEVEIHSTRSEETDEDMDDFIVHDEDVIGVPSSLASSPPSAEPQRKRRRLAQRSSQSTSLDSDEDLPDVSMLVQSKVSKSKVDILDSGNDIVKSLCAQRKSRKRIVEDSEDGE